MRVMRQLAVLAILALAPVGSARAAGARRTVLKIEGERIFVDVGSTDGVQAGMELRLYHAITATHPVTKKKVRDTFYLGNLMVLKVGKKLAVASAGEEVLARIQPGDEIELAGKPQVVVDAWEEKARGKTEDTAAEATDDPTAGAAEREAAERRKTRAAAQLEVDAAAQARDVWARTLGKPIPERVALWTEYVNHNPDSPYVAVVKDEIATLTAQENVERALAAREQGGGEEPEGTIDAPYLFTGGVELLDPLAGSPPRRAYEAEQLELAYLVVRPAAVRSGWVHYRRRGEGTYRSLQATLDGDGYLRVRLPEQEVRPPELEYFVEVLGDGDAKPVAVVGSAAQPATVVVDASVAEPPRDSVNRSRVTMIFDFVDFDSENTLDEYLQGEIDFMYRFRWPIYAMRLGFATLRGTGGPKDVIDVAAEPGSGLAPCTDAAMVYRCRKVAFNYAYVELELHATEVISVMGRLIYGSSSQNRQPAGQPAVQEFSDNAGVHLRVRLGEERQTNLALGLGAIAGFGKILEAAFTWSVVPRVPIVLTAQVTDQPVPEDFGVRLIFDVGYRGPAWLYPSVRFSYAARDIDHAGVGIGTALNFDW